MSRLPRVYWTLFSASRGPSLDVILIGRIVGFFRGPDVRVNSQPVMTETLYELRFQGSSWLIFDAKMPSKLYESSTRLD